MNAENGDFGKEIYRAGNWVLTEECIYCDDGSFPYPIIKKRLWAMRNDIEDVFHWPLHIVDKRWSEQDIYDFNNVFFYALDYFRDIKTQKSSGSIWRTLSNQKRFLESKKELSVLLEPLQEK